MDKNGERDNIFLVKILSAVRRYLFLIIIVLAVFIGGGIGFSLLRTTYYIASQAAVYSAQNTMADENDEAAHINAANGYLDTFADFIDEGNVISRANYYYYLYKESGKEIDEFITDIKADYDKRYDYGQLQSNIGKAFNVFCNLTIYSSSGSPAKSVERMYTGRITGISADGISFSRGGQTFTVKQSSVIQTEDVLPGSHGILTFRYARMLGGFQPEYVYEDLEFAEGIDVKVYKKNAATGEVSAVRGTLKNYSEERIVLTDGEKETGIVKDEVVSVYADYPGIISEESCSVSHTPQNSSERSYGFVVKYKDKNASAAKINVRLIILAAAHEADVYTSAYDANYIKPSFKYFKNVKISLADMGSDGVVADISKIKIVLIFGILGVCASAIAVYIAASLDRTIKSKKQLESITGLDTLAVIEDGGIKK